MIITMKRLIVLSFLITPQLAWAVPNPTFDFFMKRLAKKLNSQKEKSPESISAPPNQKLNYGSCTQKEPSCDFKNQSKSR